jgi:hypothetical protein
VQEIEHELESGVVHLTDRAQVSDAAELTQALDVEKHIISIRTRGGTDESLLLIMKDGLEIDARQFGYDSDGITGVAFRLVNGEVT